MKGWLCQFDCLKEPLGPLDARQPGGDPVGDREDGCEALRHSALPPLLSMSRSLSNHRGKSGDPILFFENQYGVPRIRLQTLEPYLRSPVAHGAPTFFVTWIIFSTSLVAS